MPFQKVKVLDYNHANAEFTSKTWHGFNLYSDGVFIGRCNSYQPTARTRTVTAVRELSRDTFGRVIEQVPGIADGYTISIARVEVWEKELELAFGFDARFDDLTDQDRPFTLKEELFKGASLYHNWIYTGCWFSSLGEDAYTADGDAIVRNNAEITYTYRHQA